MQQVVGGIVVDARGRVLCARRSRPDLLAGRWEFPGGKVEAGETQQQALARELREELAIEVVVHAELPGVHGAWPIDRDRQMRVWFCRIASGEPTPGDSHDEVRWLAPVEALALDWLPADVPVVEELARVTPRCPVAILNPVAKGHTEVVEAVTRHAVASGWPSVTWLPTTRHDFGGSQSERALELGADLVIVGGGDGTVRAVAERLRGTDVEMGIIPLGTANIYARNLGLSPRDLTGAVDIALRGRVRRLDLGVCRFATAALPTQMVRDHLFLVVAGLGHDATTVAGTRGWLKKRIGWAAYFESGARHLGRRSFGVQVTDDAGERRVDVWTVLVGNAGTVPPGIRIFPDAHLDDGWLRTMDVCVHGLRQWLPAAVAGLRPERPSERLVRRRSRRVRMVPDHPMDLQLDGDVFGPVTRVEMEIAPQALLVRTPEEI